jgi:hypothetical protein
VAASVRDGEVRSCGSATCPRSSGHGLQRGARRRRRVRRRLLRVVPQERVEPRELPG